MAPRKASARTAAARNKRTTKPTGQAKPIKSTADDTMSNLDSQFSGMRVASQQRQQQPGQAAEPASPSKAARSKFLDDDGAPVKGLPDDLVETLLKNYDLEVRARLVRLQNALEVRQAESRVAVMLAVQKIPQSVKQPSLESFLADYGGDVQVAAAALGKGVGSSSEPLTQGNTDWDTLKAELRLAGLKRSPSKSPTKRTLLAPPERRTRPEAGSRPARVGEPITYFSVQGTPLQGIVMPDGRVLPLHRATQDQPTDEDGPAQRRLTAARQMLGNFSSVPLPSSPSPRRPGRVAAAAAAFNRRAATPTSGSSGTGSTGGMSPLAPSNLSRHNTQLPMPSSPSMRAMEDKGTIYLSDGRLLNPATTSVSDLDSLLLPAAERAQVRTQMAQWHREQSQRWTG